jgi:hypothetical protein
MRAYAARSLGIRTIRDRVVQAAAKLVLEPIFEADFEDSAYGCRPVRGAVDAVKEVHRPICRGYTDVVDADLSKYFGTPLRGRGLNKPVDFGKGMSGRNVPWKRDVSG